MSKTQRAVKLYRDLTEPDEVKQVKFKPVDDYPVPEIGPGELLMKMGRASICGTDMRILNGTKTKDVRYPSVVGHEMSGTIVEVGEGVTGFDIGDRVCIANVCACGECAMCKIGRSNVCLNRQAIGYEFDGGFEEYVRLPKIAVDNGNVFKMPDSVSIAEGAVIEPLSCCMRGQRNCNVKEGDVVLIIGAGPIGLMHLTLAKAAGATVISAELNAARREKALECHADRVVNSAEEDLKSVVMEMTNGIGADVIIMTVGIPSMVTPAFDMARKGGTVCLFAGFAKGKEVVPTDLNLIHYKELNVTGSSASKLQDYKDCCELVFSGKLDLKPLVTHVFKIEQFQEAYEAARDGVGLKVEIEP